MISRYVQSEGARLHYVEQGAGPFVVLLHGSGLERLQHVGQTRRATGPIMTNPMLLFPWS